MSRAFQLASALVVAGVAMILFLGRSGAHLAAPAAAAAATPAIGFETPSVVDPIHTFGEPDVGVDSLGRVFVSGPTGTGTQRSVWAGSVDGGHTFRPVAQNTLPSSITGIVDPPGGGDTDINFDRSGKQYFVDLYALACNRVATTTDGGATTMENIDGCGPNFSSDRPWLAVYDPPAGTPDNSAYTGPTPLIYQEYNSDVNGGQWDKSTDGLNYTNAVAASGGFGPDGYPAIDQQTGKVFQAAGNGNSLQLNIGTPDAAGDLTFRDAPGGPGLIHIADHLAGSPDTLFSVLSMDSKRNLFVAYAVDGTPAQRQVYVSAASAASGWTKWTTPVQVSDGSTATGDATNVFPWIKAGGPGRADAVWYGSDKQVDPSGHFNQSWNVFMSQVVFPVDASGAITGAAPSKTLVKVSPHPMHYDDVCLSGTGCITSQGNRNLADFFVVTIDRSGAAEIVYDDTSNGLAQPGFTPNNNQTLDHAGAGVVTLIRQSSGMGLFGTNVTGPSNAPVSGISDPAGDAKYPVIGGTNVAGMDIVGSSLSLSPDHTTLNVTMKVVDLSNPSATATAAVAPLQQYVTRWQMGNTLYYAAMSSTATGSRSFYAGKTQSVDLCSVSACFPHVLTYNEPNAPTPTVSGSPESGGVTCPTLPSATDPCTLTVQVNVGDVGSPDTNSLLEEVGAYAFAASHPENVTTNAQAEADNVPLEIDGACCYNFNASGKATVSACSLGYPFPGNNPRTNVAFNESTVLKTFGVFGDPTDPGGQHLALFYNDEHAMTLGVNPGVTAMTKNPDHASSPNVGDRTATDPSGRPEFPAAFVTNTSSDPNNTSGDWQQQTDNTTAISPSDVFGTWKAATMSGTTIKPGADPAKNNWNLGTAADPVPLINGALPKNEGYGTEASWSFAQLGLVSGNSYRIEFMVHDGDQNKSGGDSGEACVNVQLP
jgi:hypothetical protein